MNIHTALRSGPLLGISLDKDAYIPGDIITGHVFRQFQTISPDATVSICMFGRGRTIGVIGNNSQEYRGLFDLCYRPKIIFQGPIHIESSKHKHKWPFTVQLKRYYYQRTVSSHRLVPGMQDTKVSWKDKIKQSLHSSKDPALTFDLFVEVPKVVQLDNPTPIPFTLLVSPNWEETSDAIRDVAQDVELVSVRISVVTTTTIICHAGLQVPESTEIDLGLTQAIKQRGTKRIPFTADSQPIDIGEMINLRIGQKTGYPQHWTSVQSEFTHSFQIYNIRVSHQLKWSVQCEIAGERFKAEGKSDLLILKPSDDRPESQDVVLEAGERIPLRQDSSWIRPPAEEQLPSFLEAQRDEQISEGLLGHG